MGYTTYRGEMGSGLTPLLYPWRNPVFQYGGCAERPGKESGIGKRGRISRKLEGD